jgi:hypothetical protein
VLWKSTLTRSSFPTTFAELKSHISNEYSNQMTDPERAKVILNVVGQGMKKTKEQELSLNTDDKDSKGKCTCSVAPKTEKKVMCLMTKLDAQLYCEPCNLMGVGIDEIDFIYDTGTVSGVIVEKEKEILKNVEDVDVFIETATGERSISKQHGDTIFRKTRILKGRQGSVLVS